MSLEIMLLGPPRARRDGQPVRGLRGTKVWALLAYLLSADQPVPRERLARLLFPDAVDPAAALRWDLSQLRRHLGIDVRGDPVETTLPSDSRVDVQLLARSAATDAAILVGLEDEFLGGVRIDDHSPFALWIEGERRHVRAMTIDALREAAVVSLAQGDAAEALISAERVARLDPLDENASILLIRCLREAGRHEDARAAAEAAAARLREDLGVEPSTALWSAVHASTGGPARAWGRVAVEDQLDAGEAALAAGMPDAGIDALREAVGGSRAIGHPGLLARSLTAMGTALIHAVRGRDQGALALLHEAIPLAEEAGMPALAVRAERELAYVDLLRGRYERATWRFDRAAARAEGDDEELAWVQAFAGAARTDVADYHNAARLLDDAVARAEAADTARAGATARAMRGRLRLLCGDADGAIADLDASVRLAGGLGWRSFQPWPQTLRAEAAYQQGALAEARTGLERALVTSRQVADPCWESMALRGLGTVAVAEGRVTQGLELLQEAPRLCRRLPDTYLWIEVYGLDALADAGTARGIAEAGQWTQALEEVTTRHGMRALNRNASRYRDRLSPGSAVDPVEGQAPSRGLAS